MKTELRVTGMTCGHCVKAVTEALKAVPGVVQLELTLEGRATVEHDERASEQSLIAAVKEAGYLAH